MTDSTKRNPSIDNRDKTRRLQPKADLPGFVDGVPVEQLVQMAREFTARVTNADRQRLALELAASGQQTNLQASAPPLLQNFLNGKADLDLELVRRYPSSPLFASTYFTPAPGKNAALGTALLAAQDGSASFLIEMEGETGTFEIGFTYGNMLTLRFNVGMIDEAHRAEFFELIHRRNGITFLWTEERWSEDYLIFLMVEGMARLYAFSKHRFESSCRITPFALEQLLEWLKGMWTPAEKTKLREISPSEEEQEDSPSEEDSETYESPPDAFKW